MKKVLRVRALAEEKGFNINTLSFETRVTYKQIHRIWHNKVDVDKMDYGTLVRLVDALGVNKIEDLFFVTQEMQEEEKVEENKKARELPCLLNQTSSSRADVQCLFT